jgi:lipopolysaccharide/colanic/teichoic acid biosynthesis glycosyltransferase
MHWAGIILLDDLAITDGQIESLMHARLTGISIQTISEFYEDVWQKVPVLHLNHRWFAITGGFGLLHEPIHRRVKRLCDLGLAGLLLVLTVPLILLIAMWIKIVGGRGAIIYKQVRTGQNGTNFTILKLRTMIANSEVNGAQWASANDKRIILFGNILRKFRVDELPQLWNIIKGDMSFIGPRPERPEIIVGLERKIPFYSLRHLIKPGLTGWAQVSYPYGASYDDAREKLEYDLYYVKHQTIWLDLTIILRTVRVILRGFGGR